MAVCAAACWTSAAALAAPTFDKDVAPIFFSHCVGCHRPHEIAGNLPLQTYEAAKPLAAAIRQQVVSRAMPPWPADSKHSLKFRNDARLEQRDIDIVTAWVDGGALKGEDADLPPLPAAAQGWLHPQGRKPDAVLQLPEVTLAGNGEIPYVEQRVKVPLTEDRWISAMQVRPGNDAVVHHMGITEVTVADGVTPEDLDAFAKVSRQSGIPETVLANMHPAVTDPTNPDAYDMLGVYTPGTTFEMYGDNSGKLLKAGRNVYINFNIHFTTIGTPQTSRSELALWLESEPPRHQLFRAPAAVSTIIANGRQLLTDDPGTKAEGTDVAIPPIPRFAQNYELVGLTAYARPVTLYQLQPHAHMRGRDFKYVAVYPDGHEVTVLTVPNYDFHWQLAYQLDAPLTLPAGSKLIVTAHYDNSAGNKHLRESGVDPRTCGPDKEAYFRRQNQSWDEMFSPLIQYSVEGAASTALPLMQAVGCLARNGSKQWLLTAVATPAATKNQSTSAAALRTASATPSGSRRYRLLGADPFNPARAGKQRVAVKGVLIEDPDDARLNVTSLQAIGGSCL